MKDSRNAVRFTKLLRPHDNFSFWSEYPSLMKHSAQIVAGVVAMLWCGCAHREVEVNAQHVVREEFVGTSPVDVPVYEFLGLTTNLVCESITWRVQLLTEQDSGRPAPFRLEVQTHVPQKDFPNRSEDGPKLSLRGTWATVKGAKGRPEAAVYRLTAENSRRSLSFQKFGDDLLHMLNPDGSLAIGHGGASYTLNRTGHTEKAVDRALIMQVPDMSYQIAPRSTGPAVFGIFEGRSPCPGIAQELKSPQHPGCFKAKWRLTLYKDPETSLPTTYKVEGTLFRAGAREGMWSITRGVATDPGATVYQLSSATNEPALLLQKGDDNVLFFLNQNRELLVGHSEFSYTLNRLAAK